MSYVCVTQSVYNCLYWAIQRRKALRRKRSSEQMNGNDVCEVVPGFARGLLIKRSTFLGVKQFSCWTQRLVFQACLQYKVA